MKAESPVPNASAGAASEREALFARWDGIVARLRALSIEGGAVLRQIVERGYLVAAGAGSAGHFGELRGSSAPVARTMIDLDAAVRGDVRVRPAVLSGAMPVERAAVLGQVERYSWLKATGDDWFELAQRLSTRDLRQLLARRFDEHRQRDQTEPLTLYVTRSGRRHMERARDLVARARHEQVALGHAVTIVVEEWLAKHDPMRRGTGTRRVPDSEKHPYGRYIPAAVDRTVRDRTHDVCAVPFCGSRIWVDRSHRVARSRGGCNEAFVLDELCDVHHLMYERKLLIIEGPPDAPIFRTASGQLLGAAVIRAGSPERPILSIRAGPVAAPEPRVGGANAAVEVAGPDARRGRRKPTRERGVERGPPPGGAP